MKSFKEYSLNDRKYIVNVWIFRGVILLSILFLLFIFYQDSWSGSYHGSSVCPNTSATREDNGCFNSFFNSTQCNTNVVNSSSALCTVKLMYPGEVLGEVEPWYMVNVWLIILGLTVFGLLFNTLLFNRDWFGGKPPNLNDGTQGIGGIV
jgi:hypothetical protein